MKALLAAALLLGQQPGPQPDGSTLLASGWSLRPAGRQIPLGGFPMSTALTPDSRFLLVLQIRPAVVRVFDAASLEQISSATVADAWLGLTVSPNGRNVYVGGGSTASVLEFALSPDGQLTPARTFPLAQDFVGDVALSPDGRLLYAALLTRDTIAVINPLTGIVIERIRTGRRPYRMLFHPDGKSFYVSAWADAAVIQHKAETGERLSVLRTGPQPMDMAFSAKPVRSEEGEKPEWRARLFIASANTNNVYVAGVSESGAAERIETISVALTPRQPAGMTPSALALSPDESRLYVACADANAVAVVDISFPRSTRAGFIPTGHYPADVQILPSGRVFILNGKSASASAAEPDAIDTEAVLRNTPYRDSLLDETPPLPPIEHVIHIAMDSFAGATLAQDYALLDNFHAIGGDRASEDHWITSAIAPPYVVRMALAIAANEPAALPPAGRIWNNASLKGLTVRSYGWFDDRANSKAFLEDLAQFEREGRMPRLTAIRIEDDEQTLRAIVAAVTKSKFWSSSAVFVSGRKAAAILSPATRGRGVDSTFYNSAALLRTMELLLGLKPMTMFDAAATPMTAAFKK
jgi:YVTN family beta-propeller protein